MKQLLSLGYIIVLLSFLCSSCVGTKKFKALEEEKLKLENTLLGTKQELSQAKRELNKLKDASSSANLTQSGTIKSLQQQLEDNQSALDAAQSATVNCQAQLKQTQKKLADKDLLIKTELEPYRKIKSGLTTQNRSLRAIRDDINALLAANPEFKLVQWLNKDELTLTFDNKDLFSSSSRSVSSNGRALLYQLAELFKKYPAVYIDINGHMPASSAVKDNWKNSTRKTLSVLYTLTQKDIPQDKIRVIGYGQFKPIVSEEDPEANHKNSRTEIVLHYQNLELLKVVPID
ncbi:OmpA family protein [Aureispira sp. CCB-E]|uniref:OmpA/MotB family protein n=1 Tax=Aureispira sp. CCB-E TaxID=3051121 RepID=UPI002868F8EF|nr:OmpA family protein [Aureispira sp. CCB-E]WMX12652.1 OmpA family protein [Aureispira sp. CCB-E]